MPTSRKAIIQHLQEDYFDLIIIGGGATGAGIALDASSRGLKVALVEKGDFASGTSSKSTKLIHGGLRYLKQLDIALVRETGTERATVNRIAPHLCLPEKMLLPLTEDGTYGKYSTSLGLFVYDILAGVDGDDRRKMLSKEETLAIEPLLDANAVVGGGYYAEYRTDDARLTIELIKKAMTFDAVAMNYCEVHGFHYTDDEIDGVRCTDHLSGEPILIKGRRVVSAAGPWVDQIRKKNDSVKGKRLHLTKGVHLVFPREKFPVKQSLYFDEPSGRMLFAIPRGKVTYLGTTDTNYSGDLDRIICLKEDRDYLLNAVNRIFPSINLTPDDVISNWAGLRPLIHEDGKSPSELSRKDEIFVAPDGLISIAGGKLTGYRKMGERIVDLVIKKDHDEISQKLKSVYTKELPLGSENFMTNEEVQDYITDLSHRISDLGLDPYYGWYLVTTYGKQSEKILAQLNTNSTPTDLAIAEVRYGLESEMIARAEDYFVRRTGRLYFDIESIDVIRSSVMSVLSESLEWTPEQEALENKRLDELIFDATHYYDVEFSA